MKPSTGRLLLLAIGLVFILVGVHAYLSGQSLIENSDWPYEWGVGYGWQTMAVILWVLGGIVVFVALRAMFLSTGKNREH